MKIFRSRYHLIGIGLSLIILVVAILSLLLGKFDLSTIATLIGTSLGILLPFLYFAQKQDLEEVRLFKELFTEFNQRYASLNDGLNRIRHGDKQAELTTEEIDLLNTYFNLCGEEYLFAKRRYIYSEVWIVSLLSVVRK
jgi:uncharacterized membrane protein YccC